MDDPSEYIDFEARYRGWVSIRKLAIGKDTRPEEVVAHLASIRESVEGKAYSILGIKTDVLDSYLSKVAAGISKGYASAGALSAKLDSTDAKMAISGACSDEKLAPLAKAYLITKGMSSIGVHIGLSSEALKVLHLQSPKAGTKDSGTASDISEYVDFMAKYGAWVSIKRLGIRADTRPEAVAFQLAGVRATIDSKVYLLAGVNTAALDDYAKKVSSSAKRGVRGFGDAVAGLASDQTRRELEASCKEKSHVPIAENYLVYRLAVNAALPVGLEQETMSKIWKDLKVKKPPGRGAKGPSAT